MSEFLDDFEVLSRFGALPSGGVERQAATAADGAQRTWFRDWLTARGFRVLVDEIGNQFGLFEFDPSMGYVLAGSHLDSQPKAGRFDGAYGVLAGAHAAAAVVAAAVAGEITPTANVGVVNWFNEEGSRFKPSMMGSGVFTGKIPLETALETADTTGITVRAALEKIGQRSETAVLREPGAVAGYAEIHIEQGPRLEKAGITIGAVTGTWAANKYEVEVLGAQAHTGATPMDQRQDALFGAALAVAIIRELAEEHSPDLHSSCGQFTVYPNSPVVVPERVHMHFDLRSPDSELLARADEQLRTRLAEVEVRADVQFRYGFGHRWPVASYQPEGVALVGAVAAELGLSHTPIQTLAGHDSTNMKDLVPTVMVFVPSVGGISHNEYEFTSDEDLTAGVRLLGGVLARMVGGEAR